MEVVKNELNADAKHDKSAILLIVCGIESIGKTFVKEALTHIISQAGYSVSVTPYEDKHETDFHIIVVNNFEPEKEREAALVFGAFRNPFEVIEEENSANKNWTCDITEMLNRQWEMIKYLRSSKLAHVVDYNAKVNEKGLHNYTTLRNLILPLTYAFQQHGPAEGKKMFSAINPQTLIELLVPELVEQGEKASKDFEKAKTEWANQKNENED